VKNRLGAKQLARNPLVERHQETNVFKRLVSFLIVTHLAAFIDVSARAQERPAPKSSVDVMREAMSGGKGYAEAAISPDGRQVAWVEGGRRSQLPGRPGGIYVTSLRTPAQKKRIATGSDIAWSPDGKQLVFRSGRDRQSQPQLFVVAATGGQPRQVTELKGLLSHPKWSADGKKIAFLFIENAKQGAGPLGPKPAETGVIGESIEEQRLAVVDLVDGNVRQLSPADLYVYEYDWSGDATQFVISAAHGSGDNNWYIAQIYSLSAAKGEMKSILDPKMQIGVPRWSPDGKTVAFIGGLMSDEGFIAGDIYTVPATGGTPRNLTAGMKATANWLTWMSNGILFTETIDGGSGIAVVDPQSAQVKVLWTGAESIAANRDVNRQNLSVSRDGTTSAVIRQSYSQPPEVWAGTVGQWEQITNGNQGLRPMWGEAKSLHWRSDEWTIQGWLLCPYKYDPGKRYPMVVVPHGGPTSATLPRWPGASVDAVLLREGYFIFLPNFRGSTDQGEKFVRANVKEFGHGDLRDILTGVDQVLKTEPVDAERLGITGGSYGGYMTMWAVTQTQRFKAAVAVAGISNWQSYYGQNGIDQWLIPFFGASVYDDPVAYAKSSPINFIKNVKTPTLVLVGEHDIECPVPQSYEFYRALKRLGVPTQLVVYPGEGHGFFQLKHRRDSIERSLAWFEKYLGTPSQKNDQDR
jgi:dipeptidyl aminopeptidase/acylaminoacyl peptidase